MLLYSWLLVLSVQNVLKVIDKMKSLLSCSCSSDSSFGDPLNLLLSRITLWTVESPEPWLCSCGSVCLFLWSWTSWGLIPYPKDRILQYLVMSVPAGQQVSNYWISISKYSSKKLGLWGRGVSFKAGLELIIFLPCWGYSCVPRFASSSFFFLSTM